MTRFEHDKTNAVIDIGRFKDVAYLSRLCDWVEVHPGLIIRSDTDGRICAVIYHDGMEYMGTVFRSPRNAENRGENMVWQRVGRDVDVEKLIDSCNELLQPKISLSLGAK